MFSFISSPTAALYLSFILSNFYSNVIQFPIPSSGLYSSKKFNTLFLFTMISTLLSLGPIIQSPPPPPETIESSIFGQAGVVCLSLSLLLFFWTAITTGTGRVSAIYSKAAGSTKVLRSGPYAWIRHPAYTSWMLGFIGVLGGTMGAVKPEAMELAYQGKDGGSIGPRIVGLILVTGILITMVLGAGVAEEKALLKGPEVDKRVKEEYAKYRKEVRSMFVPGVL